MKQGAEGPFPEAAHAVAQLAQLVEHVVAMAPKQHKERGPGVRAGGSGGRRRPGPKPLSAHQQQALRAGGSTHVAARPQSLLRRWAAALRGAGGRGAGGAADGGEQPSPAVTAAMAMAQSLLYLGADSGILGEPIRYAPGCAPQGPPAGDPLPSLWSACTSLCVGGKSHSMGANLPSLRAGVQADLARTGLNQNTHWCPSPPPAPLRAPSRRGLRDGADGAFRRARHPASL